MYKAQTCFLIGFSNRKIFYQRINACLFFFSFKRNCQLLLIISRHRKSPATQNKQAQKDHLMADAVEKNYLWTLIYKQRMSGLIYLRKQQSFFFFFPVTLQTVPFLCQQRVVLWQKKGWVNLVKEPKASWKGGNSNTNALGNESVKLGFKWCKIFSLADQGMKLTHYHNT